MRNGGAYSILEKSTHMWYVIQVSTGKEEQILEMIKKYGVQEYLEECFIPKYERRRKYLGQWQTERAVLFPGYIFIISDQIEDAYAALKQIPKLTKVIGVGETWTAMSKEDIEIVEYLSGKDRLVRFSEGYIEGNRVTVVSGALQGLEGTICKIDRHKRLAWLEMEMFGRKTRFEVGLEIVRKEGVTHEP